MRHLGGVTWALPEHLRGLVPDRRVRDLERWCCEHCGVHALVEPGGAAPALCTNCGKYALEPLERHA
jgi:hypothetical protein